MARYRVFDGREYTIVNDNTGVFKSLGYTPIDEEESTDNTPEDDAPDYSEEEIESLCDYFMNH